MSILLPIRLCSNHAVCILGRTQLSVQSYLPLISNASLIVSSTPNHTPIQPVQFSSVTQLCPILCDPMDCSRPGLPVHHQLSELTQTHVHQAVTPSNYLILCCPLILRPSIIPAAGSFQMSQFFTSSDQILEFQIHLQAFQ